MKIKNLKLKIDAGFTLIELLIVIALLGALAVGLLATVDPFEQLKKGTDTSLRNTTSEVYNAAIRYYSVKSAFPWSTDVSAAALSDSIMTSGATGYIQQIISAGELKPEFIELAGAGNLGKIFLTSTADAGVRQNISACFKPESKSFRNEPNSKYNIDGGAVTSGCLAQTAGGSACYWCIK